MFVDNPVVYTVFQAKYVLTTFKLASEFCGFTFNFDSSTQIYLSKKDLNTIYLFD